MSPRLETERLSVARCAARLFLERGIAATTGGAIAEAAGISERTLWRYCRNKESCVAPLFERAAQRFAAQLRWWPHDASLEAHLAECFDLRRRSAEEIADGLLVVRLIAAMPEEPDLRSVWLLSYRAEEEELTAIIADRLGRSRRDFAVRLCAVAAMGASRLIDETVSMAAIRQGRSFTAAEVAMRMGQAIRAVSNLPFCDPVEPKPFGAASDSS